MNLYALPRIGQAGLGNELFPWARAELFASETGARLLAPRWTRLRLGPYLRREPEKRRYSGFFHAPEHLHGLGRSWIRMTGHLVAEGAKEEAAELARKSRRPWIVEFSGLADLFAPLGGQALFVREKLWRMTDPDLRPEGPEANERFVALHVRRGDLTRQGFSPEELRGVLQFTPLSWFQGMVRALQRVEALSALPILVFTDGDFDEVRPLLELRGVSRPPKQAAISDLWRMGQAALLFASGFSTFGMWASFLGGMPTIYAPGKIQQLLQRGRNPGLELELHEGAELPEEIVAAVVRRTGS